MSRSLSANQLATVSVKEKSCTMKALSEHLSLTELLCTVPAPFISPIKPPAMEPTLLAPPVPYDMAPPDASTTL